MKLTEEDYTEAAQRLGCDVAAIQAVAEVEAGPHGGFLPDGAPTILFERHVFHRLTKGEFDNHPDISNAVPGGYGKVSEQHGRLEKAAKLNRSAALQSASWGLFQVLGANWSWLKYDSLQEFVNAMYRNEREHLDAFVRFVQVNNLARHLREKRWTQFAKAYNGPNYWKNSYDVKIAMAYKWFGGK